MRKKFLLVVGLINCLSLYCTANLIKDGEFNSKKLGRVSGKTGTYKLSVQRESNGNKCAKLEITKVENGKNGKKVNIAFFIGADEKNLGFPVEPGTEYKFSLMLKGNQARTSVRAEEIRMGTNKRTRLKTTYKIPVKIESSKWNQVEGTFTTSKQAKQACFIVQFWWDEKYGPMMYKEGDYVLIDKAVVEKAPDKLAALTSKQNNTPQASALNRERIVQVSQLSANPVIDGNLDEKCWKDLPAQNSFFRLGRKQKANVKTQFKIFRNGENIYIGVKCFEPDMRELKAVISENGKDIWKDDVVEVFFSPAFESSFLQFAVSAGGGRYIGEEAKELSRYGQWDAKVYKGTNYWSAEFKIPYKLMWDKINENDIGYRLNVCRQRKSSRELSSWSPVVMSFQSANEFGRIFFGDGYKWTKTQITELKNEITALPASTQKDLTKKLNNLNTADFSTLYNQLKAIKEQIKFAKVADRKFIVTEVQRHRAPRIPFLPDQLMNPPKKITLTASVNEVRSIPLAITNLTGQAAEYQVLLCSEKINRADEKPGLKSGDARFPVDKIKCLRAIRVKETDNADTSVRFDPLVEVDRSHTVTAPSKDSALFYYKFDCRDVKPGIYKGFLHVIPLSEPSLSRKATDLPQIQSIPFELNVLPIELSQNLRTPLWYYGKARDKKLVRRMLDEGITYFPVAIWGISAKFDDKGNIISKDISGILNNIAKQRKWAAEYRPGVKIKHVVIYSLYEIFMRRFGKNRFKEGTPEWKNAYKNWVKLFIEVRRQAGLSPSEFMVEIQDEPAHSKHSPSLSVILEASKMTKEAAPDLVTILTFGSNLKAKDLYQFIPYVDIYIFWEPLLNKNGYSELTKKLRKSKRQIWIYRCDTGICSDLYGYYRLHSWRGESNKVDVVAFYVAYCAPSGFPAAWRKANTGNYLLLYGDSFSTIRNESFITGFNDLKYYDKLENVTKQAKAKGKNPALVEKAEKFLRESPEKISRSVNDFRLADQFRKDAVDLILKLQGDL